MNPDLPQIPVGRVEEFRRRHRTGLVALVFTDLVDSVALRRQLGDQAAASLLQTHRRLVRDTLARFPDAEEIETAGDSFLLLLPRPSDAVKFAVLIQRQTRALASERNLRLAVRMGIHVGEVVIEQHEGGPKPKDLYGTQVDLCARVMGLAEGGQILLTRGVFDSARQALKGEDIEGVQELSWLNHGPYLLKGIEEAEEVCEVGEVGISPLKAPVGSEKAQRQVAPESEPVLGWRPALGQAVPHTQWILEKKLGEGGFGEVWLGRHQKLKERRVFKFCFRADRVRSLKREMTLFRLIKERIGDHPNIVRLLEVYFEEPPFYVVMDHVEGQDLKAWCDQQGGADKVPLAARLEIVAQIADALQAAHDAGVIHRDVKPGNVLVRSSRREEAHASNAETRNPKPETKSEPPHVGCYEVHAKLTDFGIGQVVSEEALQGITKTGFTETIVAGSSSSQTGSQMYMAPELLAGKPASTRSDIYSLGVVLYQLLVGDLTRPLTTDWADHISDPLLRDDLKHCFAGNPQDRFAGAGQLAKQLRKLPERRAALVCQQAELAARERAAYRRGMIRTASLAGVIVALVTTLALVALHQSRKAKAMALRESHERERAEKEKGEARRFLYVANMNLAQQAWEQNNLDGLKQSLEATQESPHRGFEWYYWQRQTHLASKTLRGHLGTVSSAVFSPDGQRIVTGSFDQTAQVWDVASAQVVFTLKGHRHQIISVAYSPDGRWIATGSLDQTAIIWEASSGRVLRILKGHSAGVHTVGFSRDGRIVTASIDATVKVWDATSGRELFTLAGYSVAFSPNGQRIVTGDQEGTAKVWEASTGRELLSISAHGEEIFSVGFSQDSLRIITVSGDQTAKVWDAVGGTNLLTLKGHSGGLSSAAFSPDGQRIVTGGSDQMAKVWDATSGRELFTLKGHSAVLRSAVFSPDGQRIITASDDRTAKVWEVSGERESLTLTGHGAWVNAVGFSPDGKRIVTGSGDQTAKMWDAASGGEVLLLKGHNGWINSVAFSPPDGQRIVTASSDQTARVWDAVSGREMLRLVGHTEGIRSVAFSPDGQRIVTGSDDRTAKVWDALSGTNLLTLTGHNDPIRSVAFSTDGQRIVTGSEDQTTKVWDTSNGTNLRTVEGHSAPISSVAFSPDGKRIVTGSDDHTARVWDTTSGTNLLTLKGHSAPVRSVAFSPDGQRILTGSDDRTARLWEAVSGRELLMLRGHSGVPSIRVTSVAFSPDGGRIAVGSDVQTATVWQAARAEQVVAWQAEERRAAQHLATLQRERTTEQERQRMVRAGDEGAIKRWLILAPIPLAPGQDEAKGLELEQIQGESRLRPKAAEEAVTVNGPRKWKEVTLKDYVIDFNVILRRMTHWSVAYAVCYIISENDQHGLQMLVGSDDGSKVYLNGKEIYRFPDGRSFVADLDTVPDIALKAGLNVLVFKVVNGILDWQGSIRLTDAQGNPVKGIKVTLDPDGK